MRYETPSIIFCTNMRSVLSGQLIYRMTIWGYSTVLRKGLTYSRKQGTQEALNKRPQTPTVHLQLWYHMHMKHIQIAVKYTFEQQTATSVRPWFHRVHFLLSPEEKRKHTQSLRVFSSLPSKLVLHEIAGLLIFKNIKPLDNIKIYLFSYKIFIPLQKSCLILMFDHFHEYFVPKCVRHIVLAHCHTRHYWKNGIEEQFTPNLSQWIQFFKNAFDFIKSFYILRTSIDSINFIHQF